MNGILAVCLVSMFAGVAESKKQPWNYFLFVQQWPQSFCTKEHDIGQNCTVPKSINYWTIHGLWPSSYKRKHNPSHCNNVKFDMNKIKDLIPKMKLYWTDYLSNTLWEHEWFTHGTCAMSLKSTGSEKLYFQKALSLRQNYDFKTMLEKCRITPSSNKTYKATAVKTCLKQRLGQTPDLNCYEKKDGKVILTEIRICVTKTFELISCHANRTEEGRYLIYKKSPSLHPCGSRNVYFPVIEY